MHFHISVSLPFLRVIVQQLREYRTDALFREDPFGAQVVLQSLNSQSCSFANLGVFRSVLSEQATEMDRSGRSRGRDRPRSGMPFWRNISPIEDSHQSKIRDLAESCQYGCCCIEKGQLERTIVKSI